jgi:regulator of nucleoside diphosphate kinase
MPNVANAALAAPTHPAAVAGGLIISALDQERLVPLIERMYLRDHSIHVSAGAVLRRLRAASPVPPEAIPPTLVTMNSTVVLHNIDSGERREATLVYPEDHDPSEGCWSVLCPLGAAIFGVQVGDPVVLEVEGWSVGRWVLAELAFQPEARGWLTM